MTYPPPDEGSATFDRVPLDDVFNGQPEHVVALTDLIKRTGAWSMQIRENDSPEPLVWLVVVEHYMTKDHQPTHDRSAEGVWYHVDAAAGMTIEEALTRMAERLLDGGRCVHCGKPSAFYGGIDGDLTDAPPMICWTFWNPTTKTYTPTCKETTDAATQ